MASGMAFGEWQRMLVLLLVLLSAGRPLVAAGEETTTCSVNGRDGMTTCTDSTDGGSAAAEDSNGAKLCIPDGSCFDSLEAATSKFGTGTTFVYLDEPAPFGERQQVAGVNWKDTLGVLAKTREYMTGVFQNETMKGYRKECKCRNELCAFWSAIGA